MCSKTIATRKINTNGQRIPTDRTVEHVGSIYKIYTYELYYVENIIMLCTINTTCWGERDAFYNADYAHCVNASILSCLYDSAVQLY